MATIKKRVSDNDIFKAAKKAGRAKGRTKASVIADASIKSKNKGGKGKENRTNRSDKPVKAKGKIFFI